MTRTDHARPKGWIALLAMLLLASGLIFVLATSGSHTARAAAPLLTATPTPACGGNSSVSIVEFAFTPQDITVTVGTAVQWTNSGTRAHTTTSDTALWDSGSLNPGQQFSFTFITPGIYTYHCNIHPFMTGSVTVLPCSPPSTNTPTPVPTCPPMTVDDSITGFAFQPPTITIPAGSTIRWTNLDPASHTSTSDTGVWDSGTLTHNQQFSFTFTTPGTYTYYCTIHPFMTGTITVVSGCLPTATPTATNTPSALLVGHVIWQGAPAQPNARQQQPITLTLKSGTSETNYPSQTTDASGSFTVSVGHLAPRHVPVARQGAKVPGEARAT